MILKLIQGQNEILKSIFFCGLSKQQQCQDYLNGALRHGLNFYFKLVSQMILVTMDTKESRYDKLNLEDIYYYQLFQNEIFDSSSLAVHTWNLVIIQEYFQFLDLEIIVMITFFSLIGFYSKNFLYLSYHFIFFEFKYFESLKIQRN